MLTTPVIHENHPKDVLFCILDVNGLAHGVAGAYKEGHLQFKVHQATRTKSRRLIILGSGLAIWSSDGGTRHHHTRGSAMVSYWQIFPEKYNTIIHYHSSLTRLNQSGSIFNNNYCFTYSNNHDTMVTRCFQRYCQIAGTAHSYLTHSLLPKTVSFHP